MEISWESFQKIEKCSKSEPLNRKFREESQMEGKFPLRNFRKFRYASQGCPFITENFQKFKGEFFYRMKSARGYPLSVNSGKCCSIRRWNFQK